jgi:hypothetical protein
LGIGNIVKEEYAGMVDVDKNRLYLNAGCSRFKRN